MTDRNVLPEIRMLNGVESRPLKKLTSEKMLLTSQDLALVAGASGSGTDKGGDPKNNTTINTRNFSVMTANSAFQFGSNINERKGLNS